jgi:Asp-tRNA(Asn)/Glu-tRNA(Gln) amidotransferase A subunit family amidase
VLRDYDALLCPTTAVAAPPVGTTDLDWGHNDAEGRYVQFEMTFPFNMISPVPALSIPSGFTSSGLPTGIQIVGRRYADLAVLQIGKLLEASIGAWQARPPV